MAKHMKKTKAATKSGRSTATYQLGDLISVAFEQALSITKDSREAAELASMVVQRMLMRDGRSRFAAQLATL